MSQLQVTGEAKIRDIQGPVVSNSGVITALDGDASQYVRGDGTLADFPTSTGGGSSVSYYLNSSVSQGTIGGVAYRQLSKTPISGAGTDITASTNGYIASYLTDANDPALLEVPAGNFNCEFYFSVNSNNHNPYVYAEVYKYDGTTFTLIGSSQSVPEYLTNGTTLSPYYFAIPVAQTVLAITDRIAIRIYVNVDGRVVTLHTENNHLCQVVTTFSKGLTSLNNLTRQVQFFGTGTSGTDFGISSSVATHTFNLPVASATNTGKLSSTDWSTFNGKVPYTGATANVDLGLNGLTANNVFGETSLNVKILASGSIFSSGYSTLSSLAGKFTIAQQPIAGTLKAFTFDFSAWSTSFSNTYILPDLSGTLALLEADNFFTEINMFDIGINYKTNAAQGLVSGYISQAYAKSGSGAGSILSMSIADGNSVKNIRLDFVGSPATYTYTFPASSGTIALTSNLSSYVPYTGATGDVNLGNNILNAGSININPSSGEAQLNLKNTSTGNTIYNGFSSIFGVGGGALGFGLSTGSSTYKSFTFNFAPLTNNTTRIFTFPDASGTLALTSDLAAYVTLATAQTISGVKTFNSDITVTGVRVGKGAGSLSGNTALGEFSLNSNTTGNQNTGIGFGGLFSNTTGQQNTALGNVAMNTNTTGNNNTAIGFSTLISNSTGSNNTVIGSSAGSSITTGSNNTIIGTYSGTPSLSNNIVLADGQGNIRYQWNGTNNVFGNPLSGTSATFSGQVQAQTLLIRNSGVPAAQFFRDLDVTIVGSAGQGIEFGARNGATLTAGAAIYGGLDNPATTGSLVFQTLNGGTLGTRLTLANTGAATFSSSVTANSGVQSQVIGSDGTYGASYPMYSFTGTTNGSSRIFCGTGSDFMYFAAGTGSGFQFRPNGSTTASMLITSGGKVGIATTAPSGKIGIGTQTGLITTNGITLGGEDGNIEFIGSVFGSGYGIKLWQSGERTFSIAGRANSTIFTNYFTVFDTGAINMSSLGTGTVTATSGTLSTTSDMRLKNEDGFIDNALEKVLKLKPRYFHWKEESGLPTDLRQLGFYAQEVNEALGEEAANTPKTENDKWGIYDRGMIAFLTAAIQELKAEIDELKNK